MTIPHDFSYPVESPVANDPVSGDPEGISGPQEPIWGVSGPSMGDVPDSETLATLLKGSTTVEDEEQTLIVKKEHCWHSTGIVYAVNPAAYPQVCCNCGNTATQYTRQEKIPGHGPYAEPLYYSYPEINFDGPCKPINPKEKADD